MSTPVVDFFIFFLAFKFNLVNCDYVSVKITTQEHVNIVSDKFLSFTVDPRFLFAKNGGNIGEDCLCMAAALSPAYIRIGGPSTAQMDFLNSSLLINATDNEVTSSSRLTVDVQAWKRFAEWARLNRFELVFALNNEGKTEAGIWDPNTALSILSVAEEAGIEEIVWQLGYECRNRSAEEYLAELETLRVMVDTFAAGGARGWRVAAGDVTPCLAAASKTTFGEYVAATDRALDAVFLNGNSSAVQLDMLKESERTSLLELLSNSSTPLWITESRDDFSELERAADWLTSLGLSARSGFDVHFRELTENELYEPTLSFYMSLLFKNLVGNRVLEVGVQEDPAVADKASLFAHCTTLKHQPVPGAITLFGANMDEQPVRFSVKLSKREEGGDIMQFVLSQDIHGNTLVNGHPMFYEGDIKPVVKRVRPYKALLITIPPKSFGFWVLANTKIEACHKIDDNESNPKFIPATPVENIRNKMTFAHNNYQNRKKRETPLLKDDVILHKWIGYNELPKRTFVSPKFVDLVGQDILETFSEVQEMEESNGFTDNMVIKTKDKYDSENKNEMEIKYLFRHKRQTLEEKLKAAVSKLKMNSNKYEPKLPKITATKLQVPLKSSKLKVNIKKTDLKNPTDAKKILKESEHPEKKDHAQKNLSSSNPLKANEPKRLLESSKARIQELRRRLQARKSADTEETTQDKEGLKLNKRSTIDNKLEKIQFNPKIKAKRSNDLVVRKDENSFQELKSNSLRKKRSTEGLTKLNSIVEHSDVSVLKKILNKATDKLDKHLDAGIKRDYESGNFEEEIKPESASNEIPKKFFNAKENKIFEDQILLKTKISDEDSSISIDEKSNQHGLLKDTFESVSSFLDDLRENFARILAVIPNFP